PDADDRHVLAVAIKCAAQAVVTFNLDDFPRDVLGLRLTSRLNAQAAHSAGSAAPPAAQAAATQVAAAIPAAQTAWARAGARPRALRSRPERCPRPPARWGPRARAQRCLPTTCPHHGVAPCPARSPRAG